MERYKAVLWHTPALHCKANPIDSVLLKKKCYKLAETEFFEKRKWDREIDYHIEIEEMPRIVETEA
tara:strand:- start:599 stop:796 length:198 start_codon:yes stop_codon:yes gene_type:complete